MSYLAVSVGAVLGANLRYFVDGWISERFSSFPVGTLVINASGSLLIGVVLVLATERAIGAWWLRPGFAIGLLGSYTTFSTFSFETVAMARDGNLVAAGGNVLASIAAGLAGAYLGYVIGRAI
jgi:CrcB protein